MICEFSLENFGHWFTPNWNVLYFIRFTISSTFHLYLSNQQETKELPFSPGADMLMGAGLGEVVAEASGQ